MTCGGLFPSRQANRTKLSLDHNTKNPPELKKTKRQKAGTPKFLFSSTSFLGKISILT